MRKLLLFSATALAVVATPAAAKDVAKAIDELGFRAELKPRLLTQIGAWLTDAAKGH